MRAVIQRVSEAKVTVAEETIGAIGPGFMILLGVGHQDGPQQVATLADKIAGLRIFEDAAGKMNLSIEQIGGEILLVSQFTLYADCRKGRRPSFTDAAPPEKANELYLAFAQALRDRGLTVATGAFGEKMQVSLTNDGPVTIILDSDQL